MSWWRRWLLPSTRPSTGSSTSAPEGAGLRNADRASPHRRQDGFPNAFDLPSTGGPNVFDPALRHYPQGVRQSGALLVDPVDRQLWFDAGDRVQARVLHAVAASPWASHLVLRGSATMPAWVGDAARPAGDLDFVVIPETWDASGAEARALLHGFVDAIAAHGVEAGGASIDVANVASDDIWAYERADGKRLTFSWRLPGLPPGKLQCDFVFGEPLWQPPMRLAWPSGDGDAIELLSATPEQSLAWKILWLMTDWYPQGKDLYDAVLLSSLCTLPEPLLDRLCDALRAQLGPTGFAERWNATVEAPDAGMASLEWQDFVAMHPWVDPDLAGWISRFQHVLQPVFDRQAARGGHG